MAPYYESTNMTDVQVANINGPVELTANLAVRKLPVDLLLAEMLDSEGGAAVLTSLANVIKYGRGDKVAEEFRDTTWQALEGIAVEWNNHVTRPFHVTVKATIVKTYTIEIAACSEEEARIVAEGELGYGNEPEDVFDNIVDSEESLEEAEVTDIEEA